MLINFMHEINCVWLLYWLNCIKNNLNKLFLMEISAITKVFSLIYIMTFSTFFFTLLSSSKNQKSFFIIYASIMQLYVLTLMLLFYCSLSSFTKFYDLCKRQQILFFCALNVSSLKNSAYCNKITPHNDVLCMLCIVGRLIAQALS